MPDGLPKGELIELLLMVLWYGRITLMRSLIPMDEAHHIRRPDDWAGLHASHSVCSSFSFLRNLTARVDKLFTLDLIDRNKKVRLANLIGPRPENFLASSSRRK